MSAWGPAACTGRTRWSRRFRDASWAGKLHFAGTVLRLGSARLTGSYRSTPFFDTSGAPVVQPRVASREEVEAARRAAKG